MKKLLIKKLLLYTTSRIIIAVEMLSACLNFKQKYHLTLGMVLLRPLKTHLHYVVSCRVKYIQLVGRYKAISCVTNVFYTYHHIKYIYKNEKSSINLIHGNTFFFLVVSTAVGSYNIK